MATKNFLDLNGLTTYHENLMKLLDDNEVTKTAEGNPIVLTDAADAPLVECKTQITGSQDLHGYDKPWVGGAGKNKFGGEFGISYKYPIPSGATQMTFSAKSNGSYKLSVRTYDSNGAKTGSDYVVVDVGNTTGYVSVTLPNDAVTFMLFISGGGSATDFSEVQAEVGSTATSYAPYSNICPITAYTEGEIVERGKNAIDNSSLVSGYIGNDGEIVNNSSYRTTPFKKIFGSNSYTLSLTRITTGAVGFTLNWFDDKQEYISKDSNNAVTLGRISLSAQAPNNARYVRCSFGADTYTTDWQLEDGSTATTYEPYVGTTHTTTFPSAIYRGSEDCVNGEVTSTWGSYTFTGSEGWTKQSGVAKYYSNAYLVAATAKLPATNADAVQLDTPIGIFTEPYTGLESKTYSMCISRDGRIGITADIYADISMLTGMTIWFELATPTTSSVTPTNLPIKSLNGYNHIESSMGELNIEYITEDFQPIVDLIEDNSGKVTQIATSTSENYRVILSGSATNTTETTNVYKHYGLTYNPNKIALTVGNRTSNSVYGSSSFSTGSDNTVSGLDAISHGSYNTASAENAFAHGNGCNVSGSAASATGKSLIANHMCQHVFGICNTADDSTAATTEKGNYVEIVGNGTYNGSTPVRSNARTLDWNGNEWVAGNLTLGGTTSDITLNGTNNTWDGTNTSLKSALANTYEKTIYVTGLGSVEIAGEVDYHQSITVTYYITYQYDNVNYCAYESYFGQSAYGGGNWVYGRTLEFTVTDKTPQQYTKGTHLHVDVSQPYGGQLAVSVWCNSADESHITNINGLIKVVINRNPLTIS